MKIKTYIIFAVSALMLITSACEEFLEEENKAGATAELTYNTQSGIDGLVASCYSFSRTWYGKEAGLGLSEMGSDLFYYGFDNKQKSLNSYSISPISLDNNTADNACLDQYWEMFYCAVDVCNTALKYVPENTIITEQLKSQYMGEAHFYVLF
ncbi:MAG: RagB/SusD family nutrient uptake outer membrane protein, partial [Bacteroidales bacterium]|nr:RagB/SusD family nutrient uptake outer membrane protein [Bacteroidales bacterium]